MDATPQLRGRRPLPGCGWWLAGQHPSLDVGLDLQAARHRLVVVLGEALTSAARCHFARFHVRFDFHTCILLFGLWFCLAATIAAWDAQAKRVWPLDHSFACRCESKFFSLTSTWRKPGAKTIR